MMQEHDEPLSTRKRLPRLHVNGSDGDSTVAASNTTDGYNHNGSSSPRLHATAGSPQLRIGAHAKLDGETLLASKFSNSSGGTNATAAAHQKKITLAASSAAAAAVPIKSTDASMSTVDLERTRSSSADSNDSNDSNNNDASDLQPSKVAQLRRWTQRVRKTFGTSFLVLVCAVYAVQGFNSFSALAINYFFKDNLKLEPAASQTLMTLMMFPWGVKPIYGIISDSLPLCGYHRKSYMVLFSTLGMLACLALSIPDGITTPLGAVIVLIVNSLSAAVIDVVIDARVVEMSRLDPKYGANDLQSVSWMAMSLGGVFGSILSGPATHQLGVRGVFFFAAAGPSLILLFSAWMVEPKTTTSRKNFTIAAKKQFVLLKRAILTPVIWKCALWVFLSGAISPGYSQVFFYFSTDVLKFTPEFLGTVSACGFVFLLLGTLVYNAFFKDVSFRRIFLFAQLSLAIVSLLDVVLVTRFNLQLGIPDKAFVLGDAVIADVISRLKTMPVLVLCAKLCPKGVEGTLFALLMSISNFSYSVSEFWGAIICHALGISKGSFDNLWIAIVARSALKVTPILFLFLIPSTDPQDVVDKLNFEGLGSGNSTSGETMRERQASMEDDGATSPGLSGTVRESHTVNGSPIESPFPSGKRTPAAIV